MTQRPSVDDCLQKLGGDQDRFRQILSEVLLAHYHRVCEERDRLKSLLQDINEWDQKYPALTKGIADRISKELGT